MNGLTLHEVFVDLDTRFGGIAPRVLDDAGQLLRFVNVYVIDDGVRFLDSLSTPINDGDRISIIPVVAGG